MAWTSPRQLPARTAGRRPAGGIRRLAGVLAVVGCLVVGAAVAGLGTFAHQGALGLRRWPLGLLMALAITVCAGIFVRACGAGVLAKGAALIGWLVVVLLAAGRRSEGDVLIPANGRGYAWLLLGFAALLAALVLPIRRQYRSRAAGSARG